MFSIATAIIKDGKEVDEVVCQLQCAIGNIPKAKFCVYGNVGHISVSYPSDINFEEIKGRLNALECIVPNRIWYQGEEDNEELEKTD